MGQPGSNPLDLFKFYVEDLKARLHDERKIVKDILKDRNTQVEIGTSFEEFYNELSKDQRALALDQGNIRLAFQNLVVKAEARDKERVKNEERKNKKREAAFRQMLEGYLTSLSGSSTWEEVREELSKEIEFEKVTEESQRKRLFTEYIKELKEAELIAAKELEKKSRHKTKHSSHKHSSKHKRRLKEMANSNSEGEEFVKPSKKARRRISNSVCSESEGEVRKKKHKHEKKKTKKKRGHHVDHADTDSEGETKQSRRKHDSHKEGGSKSGEGRSKHKHRHHEKSVDSPMETEQAHKNSRSEEDRKESSDSEGQI